MRIPQARRNAEDLRQSFRFLGCVFLLRIPKLVAPQPVPAWIDYRESTNRAVFFTRPQDSWDAGDGQFAVCVPQSRSKRTVEAIRIGYRQDGTAIRVHGIKSFHTKQMDLYILQNHHCVRVWTCLPVGLSEPEGCIESYGFVQFAA